LKRVPGTDLCHLSKSFERDARLDYKFVIEGENWILDPRNPNTCRGGFGANSELAMPEYLHPTEILDKPDIPRGKLDTLSFHSALLKNDRRVIVYLPPSYPRKGKLTFPCVYVNDGTEYRILGSMCTVLDNLIHDEEIREIIAVFIDPLDRKTEYWFNDDYIKMVCTELVPCIDSRYRTIRNPGGRCIMGASLGGLTALNAVRQYPGVFGLCASQSGALWIEHDKIIDLVRRSDLSGLRVYLDWGSYEPMIPAIHARIARLLKAKGCCVETRVWHEGHSWGSWRAHLAELLGFLFPAGKPSP
jgi:enterochelin esterase family protein